MTPYVYSKIEPHIWTKKGEFKIRSIFGCLYAVLVSNHQQLIPFFIEEYISSEKKFTAYEIFELVEALNQNTTM